MEHSLQLTTHFHNLMKLARTGVNMHVIGLWVLLRILTSTWAALTSSLSPLTEIEKTVQLWAPSTPLNVWLERTLLAPWDRWDALHYTRIVMDGYRADNGTAQFHPLYPLIATPMAAIGAHPLFSLLIVSSATGLLMLLAFQRLALLDLNQESTNFSILAFMLFPSAFILFAPYSESLFLLFSVASFIGMRKKKWWLAGAAAGCAALTRQQGLFLLLPLAWELWETQGRNLHKSLRSWKAWSILGLVPGGYLLWIVYRWQLLSDLELSTDSLNSLIYSFLISPSANQVVEVQAFLLPWKALWIALSQVFSRPDLDLVTNLVFGAYFLILLALAWRHLPSSYRIYTAAITLVSFSYYTGPVHPYMGLLRHLLLAFPVFIGLAASLQRPCQRLGVIAVNLIGFLFLLWLYVLHVWVP
jgi:hypothetical protein